MPEPNANADNLAEIAKRVLARDDHNIMQLAADGKPLTDKQRARMQHLAGEDLSPKTYAASWDELAACLNVDRRTLTNFRTKHAAAIKKLARKLTRPDGRHVVAEWRKFADSLDELQGRGLNNPATDPDEFLDAQKLKLRALKLDLDRKEFELAKEKDELIKVADVQIALGHVLAQFRQSLDSMPARLARLLGDVDVKGKARELVRAAAAEIAKVRTEDGVFQIIERLVIRALPEPDYHSRLDVITREIEILKKTLRACPFIKPADDAEKEEPA